MSNPETRKFIRFYYFPSALKNLYEFCIPRSRRLIKGGWKSWRSFVNQHSDILEYAKFVSWMKGISHPRQPEVINILLISLSHGDRAVLTSQEYKDFHKGLHVAYQTDMQIKMYLSGHPRLIKIFDEAKRKYFYEEAERNYTTWDGLATYLRLSDAEPSPMQQQRRLIDDVKLLYRGFEIVFLSELSDDELKELARQRTLIPPFFFRPFDVAKAWLPIVDIHNFIPNSPVGDARTKPWNQPSDVFRLLLFGSRPAESKQTDEKEMNEEQKREYLQKTILEIVEQNITSPRPTRFTNKEVAVNEFVYHLYSRIKRGRIFIEWPQTLEQWLTWKVWQQLNIEQSNIGDLLVIEPVPVKNELLNGLEVARESEFSNVGINLGEGKIGCFKLAKKVIDAEKESREQLVVESFIGRVAAESEADRRKEENSKHEMFFRVLRVLRPWIYTKD